MRKGGKVMSVADIIQIISSLGFPIVACLGLGWYIVKKMDKMSDVIDNNTKALIMISQDLKDQRKE
ncbi:MAG: hypothetical protein J6R25_04150 [Bacteroidales bacterium]|nr:hypothetical protein [Bacteroidales bacterium]